MRIPTRQQTVRCSICHDASSGLLECTGCGTMVHAQCIVEHGSCPTPGCNERDPLQQGPPTTGTLPVIPTQPPHPLSMVQRTRQLISRDPRRVRMRQDTPTKSQTKPSKEFDEVERIQCELLGHRWSKENYQCEWCGIRQEDYATDKFRVGSKYDQKVANLEEALRRRKAELDDLRKDDKRNAIDALTCGHRFNGNVCELCGIKSSDYHRGEYKAVISGNYDPRQKADPEGTLISLIMLWMTAGLFIWVIYSIVGNLMEKLN